MKNFSLFFPDGIENGHGFDVVEVQTVELAINALNEELNRAPSDGIDEEGKNPFVSANLFSVTKSCLSRSLAESCEGAS